MNTTLNTIVAEINAKGFKAEVREVSKNNAVMTGIMFRDNANISPVLYPDKFVDAVDKGTKLLSEAVNEIIELYKANKKSELDIDKFFTHDYLNTHIFMAVQQNTAEDIIKEFTEYDGIEKYLYVKVDDREIAGDGIASFKLTDAIVKNYGLDLIDLWSKAKENTFATCHFENFSMFPGISMPILTNNSKVKGAVAMLDRDLIKSLDLGNEVVILPSSIHEVIVMPTSQIEPEQIKTLSNMVKEINSTVVELEEVLSNKAYIVNVDSWTVKAIA